MKYLHYELYEKACNNDEKEHQIAWEYQHKLWLEEFLKIKERLPKRFANEFLKTEFHDANIESLKFIRDNSVSRTKYIFEIVISEYHAAHIQHTLTFFDIQHFQSDMCVTNFSGCCDWLYAEILPKDENFLSFEIAFFDKSLLYFDFKKMRYRKSENKNTGDGSLS